MGEEPTPQDKNTRGLGVALRFAGAILPLAAFWVILLRVDRDPYGTSVSHDALARVFRVIAYLWAWPYAIYGQLPLPFAALALLSIIMVGVLIVRRDWRGSVTVLIWSLFWGWLPAMLIGQGE